MQKKKIIAILGIVLVVIQLVSFAGMSKMYVGLYPDSGDLIYPIYRIEESSLNIKKAMFAIEAGFDRFMSSFEDLTYGEYDYRVMTAEQITSVMIRESLNCSSGGSVGLFVYDTILTIAYAFPGILGAILIFVSSKIKKQEGGEDTIA